MTKKRKNIIAFTAFICVFAIVFELTSMIFYPKSNEYDWQNEGGDIFCEPVDSIDYIALGDSSILTAFSPQYVFNKYGYPGYNCGKSLAGISLSYYMMLQILEKYKPKVVLLEPYGIFKENSNIGAAENAFSDAVNYYCPLSFYHVFWKTPSKMSMFKQPTDDWKSISFGQYVRTESFVPTDKELMTTKSTDTMNVLYANKLYFIKFISICKKNNISVVIVSIPDINWNYEKHNTISALADENNIQYIDFNLISLKKTIGFDNKTDYCDNGEHVNINGSLKISDYLGKYLEENYHPTDRTNDPECADFRDTWEEYSETYIQ